MALVRPFRALRYDERVAGPLDRLVAPPYDVIPADILPDMVAASEHNIVRLIRPEQPELAARRLAQWRAEGVLIREPRPALWRIAEEFVGPDGVPRTRTGIVGRVGLEEVGGGNVLPHERTFPTPLQARLDLIRAAETKVSPILTLHSGMPPDPIERDPDLEATLDDTTTRLWRIDDDNEMAAALDQIGPPLVIADGHHRYAAALRHYRELRTEETAHVLAVMVSASDPGLQIFPTHRLASEAPPALNGAFEVTRVADAGEGVARLDALDRGHAAFVLVEAEQVVLVEAEAGESPLDRLDVTVVDPLASGGVRFTPSVEAATQAVREGAAAAAFLVRAPTVAQVRDIAGAGLVMPQKSTYFYPKLASGLLLSPLDE